jgi:hypothetical protein
MKDEGIEDRSAGRSSSSRPGSLQWSGKPDMKKSSPRSTSNRLPIV